MALAINSQMPSNVGFSAGFSPSSPRTFSFTNTAGTVLYAFVGIGASSNGDIVTFGAVTYGGVSLTGLFEVQTTGTSGGKLGVYRLLSPPTGANTFSFAWSWSGTGGIVDVWAGCISFTGNRTPVPEAQTHGVFGTSATASDTLTGVAAGSMVVACAGAGSSMTAQTQTLDWAANVSPGDTLGNGRASLSSTAGSVTHSYTISSADHWAVGIIEVAAAPDLLGTRTGAGIIG